MLASEAPLLRLGAPLAQIFVSWICNVCANLVPTVGLICVVQGNFRWEEYRNGIAKGKGVKRTF